jgi:hypothetical protein
VSIRPLPRFALSKIDIGSGSGVVLGGCETGGCSPTLLFRWLRGCVPTPTRLRAEGVRAGRGVTRGVEVQERGGMTALTADAVRVLQARGWDHRLSDLTLNHGLFYEADDIPKKSESSLSAQMTCIILSTHMRKAFGHGTIKYSFSNHLIGSCRVKFDRIKIRQAVIRHQLIFAWRCELPRRHS